MTSSIPYSAMISLELDRHDFVSAVAGFAHGSHLRQHVWRDIVYRSIPQMNDDEMDYFWYIFRRNLWECYFRKRGDETVFECGCENYLHVLAALHRGNRYSVTFNSADTKEQTKVTCYRFKGRYHVLYMPGCYGKTIASFWSYVPDEWVKDCVRLNLPENSYVQEGREEWWTDLSVYDKLIK